ncbi:MAG: NAD-dependent deacylase [Deltaproteobacteria bacterium]|nr:NAD-dependent deacylase [Deltaproteobacteria bacterium]
MATKPEHAPILAKLAELLRRVRQAAALTGAGVSHESGIPTFRGPGGLWRNFRPEELATPQAFARDPRLVWEWYDWRRGLISQAWPNPGHEALAALEGLVPDFTLITQNVDGLHTLAGSRRVLEVHGSIWEVRCTACGQVKADRRVPIPIPPYCNSCGGLLRPNVVWFGEGLAADVLDAVQHALKQAQVLLVVGTSAVVQPAASFALWAKQWGAKLAEINPEPTPLTPHCDFVLTGKSGEVLPGLAAELAFSQAHGPDPSKKSP